MAARLGLARGGRGLGALACAGIVAAAWGFVAFGGRPTLVVERAQASDVREAEGPLGEGEGAGAQDGTEGQAPTGDERAAPACYVVHVDGAVAAPGVVRLEGEDVRVFDAVEAAGGLLGDADTSSVNLAEPLADGAKIHIPHEGEAESEQEALPAGQAQTTGATGTATPVTLVNINQASEQELQALPGIGEVTARAIVEDRTRNGPFASCEDLMRVTGIGEKKFERVQGRICV